MTERDEPYVPHRWYGEIHFYEDGSFRQTNGSSFEKWLAAHDEAVRQEERDRIVKELRAKFGVTNRAASWIREQGKEQDR